MSTGDSIKHVAIETIPHDNQRYDTVGDYWWTKVDGKPNFLELKVSDMGDWRMGISCAVHELIEAALLVVDGVSDEDVTAFDEAYEKARQEILTHLGKHFPKNGAVVKYREAYGCTCVIDEASEPGEDRHAPYRMQHAFADGIERLVAAQLGLVWKDYEEKVTSMVWRGGDADDRAERN